MAMKEYNLGIFGLSTEQVCQRLEFLPSSVALDFTHRDKELLLTFHTEDASLATAVADALGVYCYSRDGRSLAARVVELLDMHHMTLALAESCTGGLIAAALTGVPGCSQVLGTGVVSYSWDCKQRLLHVRKETLRTYGAVSPQTAGEMARGARRTGEATLGLSITGEAGPRAAEDKPVGTVYVALADGRRTWMRHLILGETAQDRESIRHLAVAHALDLVRRYLEAYPALMAGGVTGEEETPRRKKLPELLPHRGEGRRVFWVKVAVWLSVLAIIAAGVWLGYHLTENSGENLQLQDDLRQIYWSNASDLTEDKPETAFPGGMMAQFHGLYAMNTDIGGWIRIPGTVIDYPVMQYAEGRYTNHDFNQRYSPYGQPFFDEADILLAKEPSRTLTIYGKNMRDGQMFSELLSYRRIAFLKEHPIIEMNTLYTASRWEVFAVLVMDEEDNFQLRRSFTDERAFERYIGQLRSRSLYTSSRSVTAEDRLLALSANASKEYGHDGARFVVVARQVSSEELSQPAVYRANSDSRFPDSWFMGESADKNGQVAESTTGKDTTAPPEDDGAVVTTTSATVTTTTTTTRPTEAEEETEEPGGPSTDEETEK